jgi:hypothetical protein
MACLPVLLWVQKWRCHALSPTTNHCRNELPLVWDRCICSNDDHVMLLVCVC